MINIAVLVSGGGTNLQALIDAQAADKIENGCIRLVISSNPGAFALERAAKAFIPSAVLRRRDFDSAEDYGAALTALLEPPAGVVLRYMVALGYPAHQSHLVPVRDGDVTYYLDENRDYCVPKRPLEEVLLKTL